MSSLPKGLLRDFIQQENLKSIKDIESALKDIFRDTIQEALEAEFEEELGYSKYDLANKGQIDLVYLIALFRIFYMNVPKSIFNLNRIIIFLHL